MRAALSVAEVAEALGTSPQTVRALLRKGQLRGAQRPWGSRYVWEVTPEGLDEFLGRYGRLDGRRRSRVAVPVDMPAVGEATSAVEAMEVPDLLPVPGVDDVSGDDLVEACLDRRPWVLRPRGRGTVVLVLLVLPLLLAYAGARIAPDALWFSEVGQDDVFRRLVQAKIEVRFIFGGTAAAF